MRKFFFIVLTMITMIGCASSRPIIGESYNHEREHSNNQSHVEHTTDSTLIDRMREVITRNDTVFIHDSIYIFKLRDRYITDSIHDTLYINNTDTIRLTITNEVEKPIAPFVRKSCIALWCIIGAVVILLIIRLVWGFASGNISWLGIVGKILKIFGK